MPLCGNQRQKHLITFTLTYCKSEKAFTIRGIIWQPNYKTLLLNPLCGWRAEWMSEPSAMRGALTVFVCVFFVLYSSECNSNRDSVLSYTSVRSNSSYLGSDEMGSGKIQLYAHTANIGPENLSVQRLCLVGCVLFWLAAWDYKRNNDRFGSSAWE